MIKTYRKNQLIRNYLGLKNDPIGFLSKILEECGEIARIRIFPVRFYLVNDPEMIREALVEKHSIFIIKGGVSAGLARLIGRGILTNHGENWRESRRSLQPFFQHEAIQAYFPKMTDRVKESLQRWSSNYEGKSFSLNRELVILSYRIKCSTLFQTLPTFEDAEKFADAMWVLQSDGMKRHMTGLDFFSWIPTPQNRRVNRARRVMITLAEKLIEQGAPQALPEILSLLFAGTEAPANTLVWTIQLLDDHPEWIEKLSEHFSKWDSQTFHENVEKVDVLSQVISESIRIYPAGWAFERYAAETTTLGDEVIEKGSRLLFSPFLLHRNRRFWKDPEKFDPLRFEVGSNNPVGIPKYGYLPFGAGPRSCIGSRLAWAEMRTVLSMLLIHGRFELEKHPEDCALNAEGSFKIRFNRPLFVRMESNREPQSVLQLN